MWKRWTGPRAITPTSSPILKFFVLAVEASMSTSPGPLGQLPLVRVSGLKRWPSGVWLNARPGAPPLEITLPL